MDFEVVIVGSGPAGLQAAIHAARKKVSVAVLGHLDKSDLSFAHVENYLGLPKTHGSDVLAFGVEQAKRFGAHFFEHDVMKAERKDEGFVVSTDHDLELRCKALVLAPGISRKKLNVPGEKEFLGKGVSYCAACDCNFFRGRNVVVVGDESTAASSTILLTEYASDVYWVAGRLDIAAQLMAKVRQTKAKLLEPRKVAKILGEEFVTGVELNDGTKLEVDGVFIELGAKGSADLALDLGLLPDPEGFIKVNERMETEVPGLYACGDVTGEPWQLARSVGQGCVAGTYAAKFVRKEG
ncbi:MAG TPA: NAD(P)/FAD-dependent oxidoreductase [Methanomassiliicoccales archaeon]|nr:NAD(P)/FAD-dependent oxidoreductase [Methanomassiliicoccales archaeon]